MSPSGRWVASFAMEFRRLLRKQFDMCSARGETRHGEAVEMT